MARGLPYWHPSKRPVFARSKKQSGVVVSFSACDLSPSEINHWKGLISCIVPVCELKDHCKSIGSVSESCNAIACCTMLQAMLRPHHAFLTDGQVHAGSTSGDLVRIHARYCTWSLEPTILGHEYEAAQSNCRADAFGPLLEILCLCRGHGVC